LRPARAYLLPEGLREELAVPMGPVVQEAELAPALRGAKVVACVGDVVSLTCKRLGMRPKVFVVDYQTKRKPDPAWREALATWGRMGLAARNPAGTVTREAWDAVKRAFWLPESPVRIVIDGEEDLLGLPVILEAPDGAKVLYGIPDQGVCIVTVDETSKARAASVLARMKAT
jgi:GTP-dependent dephospho-CoA kinase